MEKFFFQDPTYVQKSPSWIRIPSNFLAGKKSVWKKISHLPTKNNKTTLIVHQVTPAPGTLEGYRTARPGRGPQVFPAFPAVCNGWKKGACARFSPMFFLHWPGIKYRVILKVVLVIFIDSSSVHECPWRFLRKQSKVDTGLLTHMVSGHLYTWVTCTHQGSLAHSHVHNRET